MTPSSRPHTVPVPPMATPDPHRPDRRAVLRGAALLAGLGLTGALSGCGLRLATPPPAAPVPGPDELARRSAVADVRDLERAAIHLADAADGTAARALRDVAATHRAHLVALHAAATATASPTDPAAPTATTTPGAGSAGASVAALVAAETAAARRALAGHRATAGATATPTAGASPTATPAPSPVTGLAGLSDGLAQVLASVAAGCAVAARVAARAGGRPVPTTPAPPAAATSGATATPAPSPTATPSPTGGATPSAGADAALAGTLTAELAAVYADEVAEARLAGAARDRAAALADAHRVRATLLRDRLVAAGLTPPAAEPGWALPFPVRTAADATRLVARTETRLAPHYAALVLAATGDARPEAAGWLVQVAVRRDAWAPGTWALPGA